ncbi:hypothetical protein OSB04_028712 [Centaurea solstitialis]|uniref:Uncharacterized protein n=1 Tax=Centaurea solstitialis TaxID=347529 RepID=A0AA38SUL8_9ASTR|nr:hypothetical protein OSB04_028712 [Centaurea solstitialis]
MWKSRNDKIFNDLDFNAMRTAKLIKSTVFLWVNARGGLGSTEAYASSSELCCRIFISSSSKLTQASIPSPNCVSSSVTWLTNIGLPWSMIPVTQLGSPQPKSIWLKPILHQLVKV